jgi:hypothetical protein
MNRPQMRCTGPFSMGSICGVRRKLVEPKGAAAFRIARTWLQKRKGNDASGNSPLCVRGALLISHHLRVSVRPRGRWDRAGGGHKRMWRCVFATLHHSLPAHDTLAMCQRHVVGTQICPSAYVHSGLVGRGHIFQSSCLAEYNYIC